MSISYANPLYLLDSKRFLLCLAVGYQKPESTMKLKHILRSAGLASIIAGAVVISSCGEKKDEAEKVKTQLEEAGAQVELK